MNRRAFVYSLAGIGSLRAADRSRDLLLPSDTPDEFGFRLMWYNPVPAIDRRRYRLNLGGLVDQPHSLSIEDLRALPYETQNSRLKCVQGWSSRTNWGGLRFQHLLEVVKPKQSARAVRFDCEDKWYEYFSLDQLLSPRVMLVLDMAGKPLADRHGGPVRLIDPARYGYKSTKLITSISFVSEVRGGMVRDLGPYYSVDGDIQAGYDHPLDLGVGIRRKNKAGEITEY